MKRAGFMAHPLWVTPYDPAQRFATGDYPNQYPTGDGLPHWTAANRSIENMPLMVWYVFGNTHVPRPEDWPVMPVASIGFSLKPDDAFSFCSDGKYHAAEGAQERRLRPMRHARRIDAAGGQVPRDPPIALRHADRALEILPQPAQPAPLFAQIARLDQRVPGRHDVRHRGAGRRHRPAVAAVGGFRQQRQRVSPVVGHLRPSAGPRRRTAPRPAARDRSACACGPHLRRARPNWRRHFGCAQPNWLRPGRVRPSARSPQVLLGPDVATKSPRGAARSQFHLPTISELEEELMREIKEVQHIIEEDDGNLQPVFS